MTQQKRAIIIGAGPAGLTAAYELLVKTDIKPIIYEKAETIGGLAKTINYKGNKIDIGGHRFFSKYERIKQWWLNFLPLQGAPARDDIILKRAVTLSTEKDAPDPEKSDKVMLLRNRLSRILFLGKLFEYPLGEHSNTFIKLGAKRTLKIATGYIKSCLFPKREEKSLEDFLINRFGKELYKIFFKEYTEKVWGVSPREIPADWGYQRIRGVSASKIIFTFIKEIVFRKNKSLHNEVEPSLIKEFMYPKLGAGQLWDEVAEAIKAKGGEIFLHHRVSELIANDNKIMEAKIKNELNGQITIEGADYFFSTMPVKDLIRCLNKYASQDIIDLANDLPYRDFIIVALLVKTMKIKNRTKTKTINDIIPDNWIYIQEKDINIARIQIYNNWSPYLVQDPNTILLGLEYFCREGDDFWNKPDTEIIEYAIKELIKIGFIERNSVLDGTVIRYPKAYPAYHGAYQYFKIIQNFTDSFKNLFLIGRAGTHRYNNMDDSMLTAMAAVDNIIHNINTKDNLWAINNNLSYRKKIKKLKFKNG